MATGGSGTLFKRGDSGVGAGVKAAVEWGTTTAKIRIKAKNAGAAGNGKNVTVVVSGASFVNTAIDATQVSFTAPTTATVAMVIAWLYQQANFDTYWDANYGDTSPGDGTGTITARTVTATAGGSDGTEVFNTVGEVTSISGPGLSLDTLDTTHMLSAGNLREFIAGLKDAGEVSIDFNFLPGNTEQLGMLADWANRVIRNYTITWTDSANTRWKIPVLITNFEPSAPVDDKLSGTATFKVVGAPNFAF